MEIATIGLDLAKHVFHVHAADGSGEAVLRRRLSRRELLPFFASVRPCLVGIEACATAHHWARQLRAQGHDMRLIPPAYVKPYVRRGAKNDASDAAAICEAVTRPGMRFVAVKGEAEQAFLMLHRARRLLVGHRTMTSCALRAHLAEFGIAIPQGRHRVDAIAATLDEVGAALPEEACFPSARSSRNWRA